MYAGPAERELESLLHATLRPVILVRSFPRALIQITLQVLSAPEFPLFNPVGTSPFFVLTIANAHIYAPQNLAVLPALLQAALLALISASIPLATTYTSAALSMTKSGDMIGFSGSSSRREKPASFHVFSFTAQGDMLLDESEGEFDMDSWMKLSQVAKEICCGEVVDEYQDMVIDKRGESMQERLRRVVWNMAEADRRWKDALQVKGS
jgi:exosome complex component RRP46